MKAEDVTDTLQLALAASGCDQARVVHKPRLLSDNGSSYVSADLGCTIVGEGTRIKEESGADVSNVGPRSMHEDLAGAERRP